MENGMATDTANGTATTATTATTGMDVDEFWILIETARATDGKPFGEALVDVLAGLPLDRILDYEDCFNAVHESVYRWDVWAAAYLIHGGCSDDGFTYFRAGLISLGRKWFERVAAKPDSLARHPLVGDSESVDDLEEALLQEPALYAARAAYDRVTGVKDSFYDAQDAREVGKPKDYSRPDLGEDFDFDDEDEMFRRLPKLAELCL
jgi:hypothetical protein